MKRDIHAPLNKVDGMTADPLWVEQDLKKVTQTIAKGIHDAVKAAIRRGEAGTVSEATKRRRERDPRASGDKALYGTRDFHDSLVLQNTPEGARTVGDAEKLVERTLEIFENLVRKLLSDGRTVQSAVNEALKLLDQGKG